MTASRETSKIIFVGQFPPPVNGLTIITSRLSFALKSAGYDIAVVNTTAPAGQRNLLFHIVRMAMIARALLLIAGHAIFRGSRICYFTAEGGFGLIYSVLIAILAKLLRLRIYIHHHSFSYIVRSQPLMKLLLACSGRNAIHICLSAEMAEQLARCYRRDIQSLVLSNATFVEPPASTSVPAREELVIGLLSNLVPDKGLYQFIDILRLANKQAVPIKGVLAGPISQPADRSNLEAAERELGDRLEYRGALYGEEKAKFFADIDVFVFLTTYLNEAQPTVLFEAMAQGIPVISYDRGCISGQVADGGHVFPQDADIIPATLAVLQDYRAGTGLLGACRRAAIAQFERERSSGCELIGHLFEASPVGVAWFDHRTGEPRPFAL
jgi:glycosyltransferase involved in cell wall biosynthesis